MCRAACSISSRTCRREGYNVGTLPESPEALLALIDKATDTGADGTRASTRVTQAQFGEWTSVNERERVEARWGSIPGRCGAGWAATRVYIGGLTLGNVTIAVQPRMGVTGRPDAPAV